MDNQQPHVQKSAHITPEIRTFLESLLQDAGMTSLNEAMHEQMISELFVRLDNFIAASIVDHMPSENLEAFIKLNESGASKDEIEKFVQEKIPNAEEFFANTFLEFRELYLGNVALQRHAPGS